MTRQNFLVIGNGERRYGIRLEYKEEDWSFILVGKVKMMTVVQWQKD